MNCCGHFQQASWYEYSRRPPRFSTAGLVQDRKPVDDAAHPGAVDSPSKTRALGRRARQRVPAHADDKRRWRQKQPGGTWYHGHGRVELAGWELARWADQAGGCAGSAGQQSGRRPGTCVARGTWSRLKGTSRLRLRTAGLGEGIFIRTRLHSEGPPRLLRTAGDY